MVTTKILVVIDMQKDFITGVFGTPEAQNIVPNVLDKIEEYKKECRLIAVTQDTHMEEYYQDTAEASLPKHCILETDGWDIEEQIFESLNEYQDECGDDLIKYYGKFTFGSSDMAEGLRDLCTDIISETMKVGVLPQNQKIEIEIIGLCTDICVISNALILKAFIPFAEIIVDSRCCAGTTPENHKKALDVMKLNGITVIE